MAYISAAPYAGNSLVGKFASFVSSVKADFAKYAEYRKVLNELSSLSGRELEDLGLSSRSAADIAYQAVYGDYEEKA